MIHASLESSQLIKAWNCCCCQVRWASTPSATTCIALPPRLGRARSPYVLCALATCWCLPLGAHLMDLDWEKYPQVRRTPPRPSLQYNPHWKHQPSTESSTKVSVKGVMNILIWPYFLACSLRNASNHDWILTWVGFRVWFEVGVSYIFAGGNSF